VVLYLALDAEKQSLTTMSASAQRDATTKIRRLKMEIKKVSVLVPHSKREVDMLYEAMSDFVNKLKLRRVYSSRDVDVDEDGPFETVSETRDKVEDFLKEAETMVLTIKELYESFCNPKENEV